MRTSSTVVPVLGFVVVVTQSLVLSICAWTTIPTNDVFNVRQLPRRTFTGNVADVSVSASASRQFDDDRTTVVTSQKRNQKRMIDFMSEPMQTTVGDTIVTSQTAYQEQNQDVLDMLECIVTAADGRKADNIVALNVEHVSTLCSYMVILTGNSRPQNQAIAAAISDDMKQQHDMTTVGNGVPEGSAESGWILLDYGSIMVHIMTPKSRLYYNVEGQWREKGGTYMDISHILIPNTMKQSENERTGIDTEKVDDEIESDPFWS